MTRWRDERGAAAVEFALISTILMVILFAIIEFGIALNQYQIFVQAAREGGRAAATGATNDIVQAKVCNAAGPGYRDKIPSGDGTCSGIDISVNPGPTSDPACTADNGGRADVTVSWSQGLSIVIPFVPDLSRSVEVKAVFRCE